MLLIVWNARFGVGVPAVRNPSRLHLRVGDRYTGQASVAEVSDTADFAMSKLWDSSSEHLLMRHVFYTGFTICAGPNGAFLV